MFGFLDRLAGGQIPGLVGILSGVFAVVMVGWHSMRTAPRSRMPH